MIRIACILLTLALIIQPAVAMESAPVRSTRTTATLITDADTVQAGAPIHLALRLRIAPGWHTYWQNPGDAGVPPESTWTLPTGASVTPIAWPTPVRQLEGPLMTYAYQGEVVLPVTIVPAAGALEVELNATWLVCEKICVPEEGAFRLTIPSGAPSVSNEASLFKAAAAREPRPSPFAANVAPDGTLSISGAGLSAKTVREAWFFPSSAGLIDQAAIQPVQIGDGVVQLGLKPGIDFKPNAPIDGVLVLSDPGGQESYLQVSAKPGGSPGSFTPIWETVIFAILAGVMLNLMPCVFPVLAMKAMALARLSGQDRRTVRMHAASYTAGVLIAFLALGSGLMAIRTAGSSMGWGFQFQSPIFVAAMALLLFGVGLNLSGVFQVSSRLVGAGQELADRPGHSGSFFTGLLAVLVATPCTAPFMGAAIAAALAAPPGVTLLVFGAMGLGLASPYTLLVAAPQVARFLPRPGPWMDILKGALAFPMYAAAGWLVWIISLQAGSDGVLATVAAMVLLGFAAWVLGLAQTSHRTTAYVVALLAACSAALLLPGIAPYTGAVAQDGEEAFTPAKLAILRAEGRPVFVNMTAAWCVTCLVNERIALSPSAVRQAFADRKVAYLKGDWTRADPAITIFLREHARDGVPLYLLYAPGQAVPRVLPQILTEAEMLSQLQSLGG